MLVIFLILSFAFDSLNLTLDSALNILGLYKVLLVINLSYSITKISLLLIAFSSEVKNPMIIGVVYFVASTVRYVMYKFFLSHNFERNLQNVRSSHTGNIFIELKNNYELFSRNTRAYFNNLLRAFTGNLDYVIAGHFFNVTEIGLYKIGRSIFEIFDSPIQWINNFVFNSFISKRINQYEFRQYLFFLSIASLLPILVFHFSGFMIIELLFNDDALDVLTLAKVMLFGLFLYSSGLYNNSMITIDNKEYLISFAFILALTAQFFAIFIFSDVFGYLTLGYAFLIRLVFSAHLPNLLKLRFRSF